MALGPVDVIILGFPGNKFTGRIAPAISDLVDREVIRVLDLLFVMKDVDGTVTQVAIADLDPDVGPAFSSITVHEPGSLNHEDAEEVSDDLEPGSSALLVAFENTWARDFVSAALAADAVVIDSIRIPADVVNAVVSDS
jgi:hypothetical protein